MAALITVAPNPIDSTTFSRQSASEINPMGPFLSSLGAQYWVGVSTISGGVGVRKLRIFKSIDEWSSDTEMDAANAPTPINLHLHVYYRANIISVLYNDDTDSKAKIIEFDCTTDTYGTPGTGLANASAPWTGGQALFYKRIDDTYVVLFGSGGNFNYRTYVAGTWAAAVSLAAIQYTVRGLFYDTSDPFAPIAQLVLTNALGSSLLYAQLDDAYNLSTPITLSTDTDGLRASIVLFGAGIAIGWTSGIVYEAFSNGHFPYKAYVAIAPDRITPVFTIYNIFTGNGDDASIGDAPTYVTLGLDDSERLNAFYYETDYSIASPYLDKMWWTQFDGAAWGSPVLVYDAVTTPVANTDTPINQFLHTGDVLGYNGKWFLPVAMEILDTSNPYCAEFMLVFNQAPPPATVDVQRSFSDTIILNDCNGASGGGFGGSGIGYVFEFETGVGRRATWSE